MEEKDLLSRIIKAKTVEKRPKILRKPLTEYYYARMDERSVDQENAFDGLYYAPATEVQEAQREINCLENELVKARKQWMEDKGHMEERWKISKERYTDCMNNICNFNGYYRDGFLKRERSFATLSREKLMTEQKEKDIRKYQKEIAKLTEVKAAVEKRLDTYEVFRAFLNEVRGESRGEYGSIPAVMNRYTTLVETRAQLATMEEDTREAVVRRKKALDELGKSHECETYQDHLRELHDYHDAIYTEAVLLEDNLLQIKTTAAKRTMVLGQIKMAIDNMYKQVCKQMHRQTKIPPTDTLGQLADVGLSVKEVNELTKDIQHMLKAAFNRAEIERISKEKAARKEEERLKRLETFKKKHNKGGALDLRELFGLPPIVETTKELNSWFAPDRNAPADDPKTTPDDAIAIE